MFCIVRGKEMEKLYTVVDIAQILNVTTQTIYNRMKINKIEPDFVTQTGLVLFKQKTIDSIRKQQEKESKCYTITELSKELGVARTTVVNWYKERLIESIGKNQHGYTIFAEDVIDKIKRSLRNG